MTTESSLPRLGRRLAFAMPVLLLQPRRAAAARNAAVLVFGNSDYRNLTPLANPRRDAEAIAAMSRALGATTELVIDAPRTGMVAALSRFAERAASSELALVFFAGHGIQRRDENWLVPVDADPSSARDVPATMLPLAQVIHATARAGQRVVILDACRDDPFPGNPATGLARVEDAGAGTLVSFATSPGRVALDGSGRHSPFADALLDHLGTPGLDMRQVLTRVRRRVLIATNGQQVPWDTSSLTADVVLRDAGQPPVLRPASPEQGAARPRPVQPQRPLATAPTGQGQVAFDPGRFREINETYARVRAEGHMIPDGLLIQRRSIDGRDTPLTGSYISLNKQFLLILLSYSEQTGEASFIISLSPQIRDGVGIAWWRQTGGTVSGDVIHSKESNGSTLVRLDTRTGWSIAQFFRDRAGNFMPPRQYRFARIE